MVGYHCGMIVIICHVFVFMDGNITSHIFDDLSYLVVVIWMAILLAISLLKMIKSVKCPE